MAETPVLTTEARTGAGGRNALKVRRAGRIPAIVYGHKETPDAVTVSKDELTNVLRHHARTVRLSGGGKTETVLIQAVQHNHLGSEVLHVDFRRVSADERVRTTVAVELRGTAPGVLAGGVLDQPLHKIHIECPALAIPESIRVKIEGLLLGQAIHVKELELPPDVKVLEEPEAVVVQVKQAVAEPEPTVATIEPGANEPEIITKKKEKSAEDE